MTITRLTTTRAPCGVFEVSSEHAPGVTYGVAYEGPELAYCQCLDYQHHADVRYRCKHAQAVHELVEQEWCAMTPPSTPDSRREAEQRLFAIAALFER